MNIKYVLNDKKRLLKIVFYKFTFLLKIKTPYKKKSLKSYTFDEPK